MRFQIQEMIRVERILDPEKVQDELDVYNALLPTANELSATLLIEIIEEAKIKEWLDRFKGLDRGPTVAIKAGGETVFGNLRAAIAMRPKSARYILSDSAHATR